MTSTDSTVYSSDAPEPECDDSHALTPSLYDSSASRASADTSWYSRSAVRYQPSVRAVMSLLSVRAPNSSLSRPALRWRR